MPSSGSRFLAVKGACMEHLATCPWGTPVEGGPLYNILAACSNCKTAHPSGDLYNMCPIMAVLTNTAGIFPALPHAGDTTANATLRLCS